MQLWNRGCLDKTLQAFALSMKPVTLKLFDLINLQKIWLTQQHAMVG